jgi:hypothetical protein
MLRGSAVHIEISLHSKERDIPIEHFQVACNFVSADDNKMEPQKTKNNKRKESKRKQKNKIKEKGKSKKRESNKAK